MNKVLVVEAHSDDSAISASGYLSKLNAAGWQLHFALVASSNIDFVHAGLVTRETRLLEYKRYTESLNGIWHDSNSLPFDLEGRLDQVERLSLVSAIEKIIEEVQPQKLIVQGPSFHHDHTAVYEACIAATRPTARFYPDQILVMENPTYVHSLGPSTDFKPNFYVPLSENELEQKIKSFNEVFLSQKRNSQNYLSAAGIEAWSRYRGLECREEFAEAYKVFSYKENF